MLEDVAGDRALHPAARRGAARIHDPARLEWLVDQVRGITQRLGADPSRGHAGLDVAPGLLEQAFLHLLEQRDVGVELGRALRIEQALLQQQRGRIEHALDLGEPDLRFVDLAARRRGQCRRIEPRQRQGAGYRSSDQIGRQGHRRQRRCHDDPVGTVHVPISSRY